MSSRTFGLPVALLRLVRLEQEDGRGAEHLLAGVVPVRLRDDASVLGEVGHGRMVVVIQVLAASARAMKAGWMRTHTRPPSGTATRRIERDRVVAEVPELDVCDAQLLARQPLLPCCRSAFTRSSVMPSCRHSFADSPRSP